MKNVILTLMVVSCGLFAADEVDACRRNRGCCQQSSCCQQDNCCQPRISLRRNNNCCQQSSCGQQSSCCNSGCCEANYEAPATFDAAPVSYDAAPAVPTTSFGGESMMEPTPAVTEPLMINEGTSSDCGCDGGGEVMSSEPVAMGSYNEGAEVSFPADGGMIVEGDVMGGATIVEDGGAIIESAPVESSTPVDAPVETAIPDAPVEG